MKGLITLLLLTFCIMPAFSQKEKVQAAFIFQFTKYIQWCPTLSNGDFVISVIGDSPILSELSTQAKTKKVGYQNIVVKKAGSLAEINNCNIIFISEGKSGQLEAVKAKIGPECTLIIAEKSGMAQNGAAINFQEVNAKLVYEINKEGFSSHSLMVNSQLLNLAKKVY